MGSLIAKDFSNISSFLIYGELRYSILFECFRLNLSQFFLFFAQKGSQLPVCGYMNKAHMGGLQDLVTYAR